MGRVYMEPYDTTRSFVVASGESSPAGDRARRGCWSCPLAGRLSGLRRELRSIEGAAHDGFSPPPASSCDRSTVGALLVAGIVLRTLTRAISSTVRWARRHHPPTPMPLPMSSPGSISAIPLSSSSAFWRERSRLRHVRHLGVRCRHPT